MSARSFNLDKKRQGNITIDKTQVVDQGEQIRVILHGTVVVTKQASGDVFLNSGGYRTRITKMAINRALDLLGLCQYDVVQVKGNWYLSDNSDKVEFFDNMKIGKTPLEKVI